MSIKDICQSPPHLWHILVSTCSSTYPVQICIYVLVFSPMYVCQRDVYYYYYILYVVVHCFLF